MSTHPNVILMAVLTPDGLARKTYRAILDERKKGDGICENEEVVIGGIDYRVTIMEEDYNESRQIAAPEGSIVVYDLVTYGYGEKIAWDELESRKNALVSWAHDVCEKHHCSADIYISANYW